MGKCINKIAARFSNKETGVALIFVMVLLLLGSITLIPVLAYIGDSLKSGQLYEEKSKELYTADSGVEDGLWRIKYDSMGPDYDAYDYYGTYPYETELVNGLTANVTIRNVWFPSNYDPPFPADARDIIESEKLVVAGTAGAIIGNPYSVRIDFTPDPGDNLTVKSLGVWLPQGFEYITDNCSLIGGPFDDWTPDYVDVEEAPGGSTVVWGYYPPYPCFTDFPDVDPEAIPMTLDFTFGYTPPADNPNSLPVAIAWITTEMTAGEYGWTNPNDVPVSWDVDTRFYEIVSNSGDVYVQAFSSKCELRQMGDAMSGDYVAIGGSLLSDDNHDAWGIREAWHTPSSFDLNTIPENADVIAAYLYWAGWRNESSKTTLLQDSCNNIDTYWSYSSPTGWEEDSGEYKGHDYGDGEASRLLTLKNDMNLSSYAPGSIIITFDYGSEVDAVLFGDSCENFDSWSNGGDWSTTGSTFKAHSTAGDSSSTRVLTLKDGIADLSGYSQGEVFISWDMWEEDNLDNGDSLWYAFSSDNGSSWSSYTQSFRNDLPGGHDHESIEIPGAYLTNGFKVRLRFYGFSDWNDNLYIDNIEISGLGSLSEEDGLDFAFSGDNGVSWSNNIEVFRGDQGSFMREFVYVVPDEYTTSDFKFRFKVVSCEDSGEKPRIDNFKIINCPVDREITFKIDGEQVYFNGSNPDSGPFPLTAGRSYVMLNTMWGTPEGFSYACTRDVTAIVQKYPINPGEEHHTGNAEYTVDGVSADPNNNFSFAGWSLIVVYVSPDTAGHYIYIRDDNFDFHPGDDEYLSLDFDDDGNPGGDITNFVVPEPITDEYGVVIETVAAKVTCFVAEGDSFGTSSIAITGQASGLTKELWNPASPAPDVWNGESYPGTYQEGVDIDTFELLWADDILTPDDDVLHVDMYSYNDAWNLVYFIISVRSETVTGGTSHYTIYGG